MADSTVKQ